MSHPSATIDVVAVSTKNPYKRLTKLKTLSRLDVEGQAAAAELRADMDALRPRVRQDCLAGGINDQRPCPWYGCKAHLGLDVNDDTGSMMVRDLDDMVHTCMYDVAELGGITLEEIGEITDLTRERIRQIEVRGLMALKPLLVKYGVAPEDWLRTFKQMSKPDDDSQE